MATTGPPCRTCTHPERAAIEAAMMDGRALTQVGKQFGLTADMLKTHRRNCIGAMLARARRAQDIKHAEWFSEKARFLFEKAEAVILEAERQRDDDLGAVTKGMKPAAKAKVIEAAGIMARSRRDVLAGVAAARPVVEMIGKAYGQIRDRVHVDLMASPDYKEMVEGIIAALKPHKAAGLDVADFLLEYEAARVPPDDTLH